MQTLRDKIMDQFDGECRRRNLHLDANFNRKFTEHFVGLLAHDARDGIDLEQQQTECQLQRFVNRAVDKFANPLDPTICSFKLMYNLRHCTALRFDIFKQNHDMNFQSKLQELTDEILRYPETCNDKQIQQMTSKMHIFIVLCYSIGSIKNHVLLKRTQQTLRSMLSDKRLQKYVMKKKYQRMEYLHRMSAIACGALIFNNQGPDGDKDNIRDIHSELRLKQCNLKKSLESGLQLAAKYIRSGTSAMGGAIKIDVDQKKVYCHWPIGNIREINKYIITFNIYEFGLQELLRIYENTEYLIRATIEKWNCVLYKINEVLKYCTSTTIESELMFPHFAYLAEVWSAMDLYSMHLTEIINCKDQMDACASVALKTKFEEQVKHVAAESKNYSQLKFAKFSDRFDKTNRCKVKVDLHQIKVKAKNYCCLTLALTNGLLVPAKVHKPLCEHLNMQFGFSTLKQAKYVERNVTEVLQTFINVIFTSSDLILLFGLDIHILAEEALRLSQQKSTLCSSQTQTETEQIENVPKVTESTKKNNSWNSWDFYRETIALANIRQCQTHSTQTALSFNRRDEQNECNYTRSSCTNGFKKET